MFGNPSYPRVLSRPGRRWFSAIRPYAGLLLLLAVACKSPDPVALKQESIRRGDELVAKKQYAQAAEAYLTGVQSDPLDPHLRMRLAKAYVAAENWPLAGPAAVRAADLLPDDPDAQLQAAELLLGPGWFPDAAERASQVLVKQPGNVTALMILGNAKAQLRSSALALSKLEEAVRMGADYERVRVDLRPIVSSYDDRAAELAFRRAVQLAPENLSTHIALANFLWATGRADESEEPLSRAAVPANPYVNRVLGVFYVSRQRAAEAEKYLKVAAAAGDSDARFALADLYVRTKRDADVLSTLGSMPAAEDAAGAVSLRMAAAEFRLNRREEAMRRIDALLARLPHNPRAVLLKAQFLFAMGDVDQALRFSRAAVSEDPASSEARSTLGSTLSATGDAENAFNEYVEALRLSPGAPGPPMELARLSLALGRDKQAVEYARQAVRKNPDNQDAAVTLVKTLVSVRDYGAADRELKPLLSRYPGSPAVLLQLARLQAARGDGAAARTAFRRALEADRDSLEALNGIVSLDLKEGKSADARALVDRAVVAHPKDAGYLMLAAQVYSASRDTSRTESTLRTVLEIDRANVGAALALAHLLTGQRRRDEAKRLLEEFVERQPRSIEAQTSLGIILEDAGDARAAQTRYEKIIAQDPRAALASYRLAALYAQQENNLEAALSLAIVAKQQLPDDAAVSDLVGWLYTRRNLPTVGLPHLQDAVRAVPDNAIYRYHLGYAHMNAGQLREAREQFTKALAIDKNFAYADQVRTFLKGL